MADEIREVNDAIFQDILVQILRPYIANSREWWKSYKDKVFVKNSTYPIQGELALPGFYEKCALSARQSCIKGIQVMPLLLASAIKWPRMVGGSMNLIERTCKGGFQIDEFTVTSRRGLTSAANNNLALYFVPTEILNQTYPDRWVYLRIEEIEGLISGEIPTKLVNRLKNILLRENYAKEKENAAQREKQLELFDSTEYLGIESGFGSKDN